MGKFPTARVTSSILGKNLIAASGAALLLLAGCQGGADDFSSTKETALQAKEVEVTPVVYRDFARQVESTGSLMPRNQATLRALVEGPLEAVWVDIGDRVQQGKTLAKTRPAEAQLAVDSAEAARETARASLNELLAWRRSEEIQMLEAMTARAEAEYDRLQNERDRAATLLERGAISKSEWEQARTAADTAEANLRVASEELIIARNGPTPEAIEVFQSRLEERNTALAQAQQQLEDTSLVAPYDGVITGRFLNPGDYVKRGDRVLEITDLSYLEAEMKIPERHSALVKSGIPVLLHIDSLSTQRKGEIIAVNDAIDLSTRTFLIKVGVDNSDESIKAGTFCVGVVELPPLKSALAVPSVVLRQEGGRSLVWVSDEGVARKIIVETEQRADGYVQILSGLSGNEEVVTEGAGALLDGDQLRVISPLE
jgi:multidrug efflux pump subunit AcrA (membrane-fusion protein)